MKGVSAVIATILMLMITIALAGMAYMYISGIFTASTGALSLVDAYCNSTSGGTATWIVRNTGTSDVSASSITITSSIPCTTPPTAVAIEAGKTSALYAAGCTGGATYVYRLRGPSNVIELSVYCA